MANLIVVVILVTIFSAAVYKIYSDRKKGLKCSGCPHATTNNKGPNAGGSCSCH